jgi:endonuclease/exonuclease/phosphatase family metal-dependent hydrolase
MFRWMAVFLLVTGTLLARPFTLLVYNVENLHDVDGVAFYDDYQPEKYSRKHLLAKVENIASVIAKFNKGAGPDVILFQEIEVDQTPSTTSFDMDAFLKKHAATTVRHMLTDGFSLDIGDLPAEAFLLKALADRGISGYNVVIGSDAFGLKSVKCVTLSRFPVKETRQFPIPNARNIVETVLDVDGYPLHVFNNHWKSGAGDAKMEKIRVENARVLRKRLDEILHKNPFADIVIGGDFNSQYNQKRLYNQKRRKGSAGYMEITAINDVLGAQGSLLRLRGEASDLYNLWFDLPENERGSDIFSGSWGTLMNLIVSRGLYDLHGVQYIPDSFGVAKFPGLNMTEDGEPYGWDGVVGRGFSDHFPIYAHFRTVEDNKPGQYMAFPSSTPDKGDGLGEDSQRRAYAKVNIREVDARAIKPSQIPENANLRDESPDSPWYGKLFYVEGPCRAPKGFSPSVKFRGEYYDIYSYESDIRKKIKNAATPPNGKDWGEIRFYGELVKEKNRGRWRFMVKSAEWVLGKNAPAPTR